VEVQKITELLGEDADYLLGFKTPKVKKDQLHIPGPDRIDRIFAPSDRPNSVLRNLQLLFNTGRLAGTGYLSILPVDRGIEHSAGASGKNDLAEVVRTAMINKRAGGIGLITGRKSFQKPMKKGIELFGAIQDVYLCKDITVA
jgi:DhnA family fructose-bisphosphate aldolase class Ia